MNSTLSVGMAKSLLAEYAPQGRDFLPVLNQASENLMRLSLFQSYIETVNLSPPASGYITLPRPYGALVGFQVNSCPMPTFGQFHEWQVSGWGFMAANEMSSPLALDVGDLVCAQTDISATATLRVKVASATDAGKVVRFYGLDSSGNRIMDSVGLEGVNLTTVNPSADTTQTFAAAGLRRIIVERGDTTKAFIGRWTLWQVVSGTETQIGSYEPGELIPSYRRYKIGVYDATGTDVTIRLKVRRQFIPLVADTDLVFPSSLRALKWALRGVGYDDVGDAENAEKCLAVAEKTLNDDLRAYRGNSRIAFNPGMKEYITGPTSIH